MSKQNKRTSAQNSIPPRLLTNGQIAIKRCKYGMMMYNLNDLFIGKALDIYGEWCESEMSALGQLIRQGDVVIDVGANIGTHAVFFAQKVAPGGLIYAVEPQRMTYELLCANLVINNLLNVIPLKAAAGETAGEIAIPILDPNQAQNFGSLNIEGHSEGESVRLMTLDELGLKRCNMIKIDVEGMELQVLKGAEKTIKTCRPFLFVENNTNEGAPETVQALMDWEYNCWWHIANYYNPNNFFQNKENIWSRVVPESNMICIPKEFNLNVTGFEPVNGPDDTWMKSLIRQGLVK